VRLALAAIPLAACYAPQLVPCAVHCGPASACPDDLTCGNDLHCHGPDDTHVCPQDFLVKVEKIGSGTGVVTGDLGIDCGTTCTSTATRGVSVHLSAISDLGSRFAGWSGSGCTGTQTCQLTVGADQTVTATFVQTNDLDVTFAGAGGGQVVSMPVGVDCMTDCSSTFDTGTMLKLTAIPDAASYFVGWDQGPCSGASDCMFKLATDTQVDANFDLL